jgi:hypothetical protein
VSPSTADVNALLATLQQTVDTAANDGSLGHDQVKDLSRRVQRIRVAWNHSDLGEFRDQCQKLRDALNNGGDNKGDGNGGIGPVALTISGIVDQLLAATGGANQ